jgi:chromosome segregation ATPase
MAEARVLDIGERIAHIEGIVLGSEKRLSNLEIEVRDLCGEIKDLRAEMKTEISGLRAEMKTEISGLHDRISGLRAEMKTEMDRRFNDMDRRFNLLQWVVVLIYPFLLAIAGKLFLMK